ncbi:DUF4079 domain-containing protein [Pseudanabaena mucicola]|uniref:DUF4079 domain-containing protein n=1 Tax=Pseudanabaena mucicola FACHB-723 TaxID=2692860 RepID=A0ABR7ZTK7_9CYAN|nr:DUF4079 domain-containing protein [Pseudanabaena mucicola]MBD2186765.1 DUF4079 domain-containing protein [Pseudanabaena mucicola FACHB-723]
MVIPIPQPLQPIVTFIHPVLMTVTFATAIYAAYLGLQYRKARRSEGEIKKALISKRYNLQHYKIGAVFLVLMVGGAIGGMAVTYNSSGKLAIGAHLFAGLGLAFLAATSASLAPLMQQGKEWARVSHISINAIIIGIFSWQMLTGLNIVQRILEQMAKAS